jgi:uncharacterized protein YndB with AHSA1/START domain
MNLEMTRVVPAAPSVVFRAFSDPGDVETLVELAFRDLGESTEIVLSQGTFKTEARHELHRSGWSDCFDRLGRFLA